MEPRVDLVAAYAEKHSAPVDYARGKYEAAAADFTNAIRLIPNRRCPHSGDHAFSTGTVCRAKAHFAEAIRLRP